MLREFFFKNITAETKCLLGDIKNKVEAIFLLQKSKVGRKRENGGKKEKQKEKTINETKISASKYQEKQISYIFQNIEGRKL